MPGKSFIMWPEYFNLMLPRKLGRKVPKKLAIPNPTIKDVLSACMELNLNCEAREDKKYPRTWFSSKGYVIITVKEDIKLNKNKLIKLIATKLVEARSKSLST